MRLNFKQLVYGFTAFALALCAYRIFKSGEHSYVFLVWNLFLAFIPWWISSYVKKKQVLQPQDIPLLVLWILFLPNAPYILTDLFHLKLRVPMPLWFDLTLILSFAFIGLLVFFKSLKDMISLLKSYVSQAYMPVATYGIFCVISFGLYLGRFLRFNSWDIIHPLHMAKTCLHVFTHYRGLKDVFGFTAIFSAFLMFIFVMINHLVKEEKHDQHY